MRTLGATRRIYSMCEIISRFVPDAAYLACLLIVFEFNPFERHTTAMQEVADLVGRRRTPRSEDLHARQRLCLRCVRHTSSASSKVNFPALQRVLRAARPSMKRDMPLKIRLMPSSVPMAQTELAGHCSQIRIPRSRVTSPSTSTQSEWWKGRILK